jgi:hypothetical protein
MSNMLKSTPVSSALAALMIASMLSGCGGGKVESSGAPVRSDSQTTADAVAQAAAAATKAAEDAAAAAATKAAEDAAAAAATKAAEDAAAAAATKAPAPAPAPEVFKMPSLVGQNLQLSQDQLQALGSYLMDQTDAAGLSRVQVLDSNWQVCAQNPAPGKTVPVDTMVVLSSVKLAEQCP